VANWDIVFLSSLVLLQIAVFYFLYQKYFYKPPNYRLKDKIPAKIFFALFVPGLLVLGIRGGFGQIPITVSQSYFSPHDILNQASVNSGYNITFNIIDFYQVEERNVFHFMPREEAQQIVRELHFTEKDTTIRIINREKPNIVIILLESWSGDLIETLGGMQGLTPEFHELEKEGLMFTEFYATGNRSQQALASIFSGLPALPLTTLTDHPGKYDALPSMVKILKDEGYYSSFFFGGDLNYGNIKSYLIFNQFDRLVEEPDFNENAIKGKLGVHDEGLFEKMLEEIGDQPEPFFTAALTLSSHSPYDQPGERPIDWIELENKYVNSAWYTDKCLGDFFTKVKEKPWYDNTLFILLSDHSHPSYNNYQWWSFSFRHIPLLFLGGALDEQYVNVKSDHLSSNMDLASTILKQLHLDDEPFFWSKNQFNPYSPQFAYLELNEGFGWKRPELFLEYKIVGPMVLHSNVPQPKMDAFRKEGEAYIQVLFREFLEY
jgi:phosphoglycerol transferase MdoB-like AlkP superfamily enzyme